MLMPPFLGEVCVDEGRNPEDQSRKWPRVSLCPGPIVPLGWLVERLWLETQALPCVWEALSLRLSPDPGWGSGPSQCMLPWGILCLLRAQVSIERNTTGLLDPWCTLSKI